MTPGGMTRVRFVGANGAETLTQAPPDMRLLDVAQAAGQPLEGTCGGEMACATCHVVVDAADWGRLAPPSPEEEELLDLVPGATRHSRLSCQLRVPAGGALTIRVPS